MKILFVVPYTPNQIRTRPFNLIKALSENGHEVTVATLCADQQELQELRQVLGPNNPVLVERMSVYGSLWNCFRTLAGRTPLQASYSWNLSLASRLAQLLRAADMDVVHVEHLRGSRYALYLKQSLDSQRRKIPVVWDSVDCISHLFDQAGRKSASLRSRWMARFELSRTRRYEGWLLPRFNRVLATSEIDRTQLLDLASSANGNGRRLRSKLEHRVKVLPNGVDLDYFSPSEDGRDQSTLVITGKMSYHANVTAVTSFVCDVMPEIWAKKPSVRLWIVGKDPTREIRRLGRSPLATRGGASSGDERIWVTGTVKDIRPFLRKATICVAPIQYGAGIQNKVLEAMACGLPVAATPPAVAGLSARPGQDLFIAESGTGLAKAILSLLDDRERRREMQESGRCFVERNHNWRSIAGQLASIYQEARAEVSDQVQPERA